MRLATEWEMKYPKFLIADAAIGDDRIYVVHLHFPRFIGECLPVGATGVEIKPDFIDDPKGESPSAMARLLREAGEFYLSEVEEE